VGASGALEDAVATSGDDNATATENMAAEYGTQTASALAADTSEAAWIIRTLGILFGLLLIGFAGWRVREVFAVRQRSFEVER
jgi:hypothetical protein